MAVCLKKEKKKKDDVASVGEKRKRKERVLESNNHGPNLNSLFPHTNARYLIYLTSTM